MEAMEWKLGGLGFEVFLDECGGVDGDGNEPEQLGM